MPRRKFALQVRIAPDVETFVKEFAERNSRTIPQEVNHILRGYFGDEALKKAKQMNNEIGQGIPERPENQIL